MEVEIFTDVNIHAFMSLNFYFCYFCFILFCFCFILHISHISPKIINETGKK